MSARLHPYAVLLLAVACVSTGAVLVRLAESPPLAVAFYRTALASLMITPAATRSLAGGGRTLTRRQRLAILGAGGALAAHFATWITSLSYTSVAASTLLVNTSPVFALGLSWLLLREALPPVQIAGLALAVLGAGIIAASHGMGEVGSLRGNLLALVGGASLAAYQIAGRGLRNAMPLVSYVWVVWGVAAALLAALCGLTGTALFGYGPRVLLVFLALAVIPTLGGHGLVNAALRSLPAPTVGLFLLGEPIGAGVLSFALFGEVPDAAVWLGGVIVLVALALVIASERR